MSHAGTRLLCQERGGGGEGTREEKVAKAVDRMEEGEGGSDQTEKKELLSRQFFLTTL